MLVRFEAEKIRGFLQDGSQFGCEIEYVNQRRLGGTADAVRACETALRGEDRFIIIYGDNYYDSNALIRFVKESSSRDYWIGAAETKDPSRFGRLETKRGNVLAIHEKDSGGDHGLVNVGLYTTDESVFGAIKRTRRSRRGEYELTDSVRILISEQKKIRTIPFGPNEWVGISYPWDLLDANRTALDSDEEIRDGVVESGVHLKGAVTLAKGSLVKSGSYIEGPVFVGKNTVVGPNSYLRAGTSLGEGVKVGAGCEVKNSIAMDDAKIPHLSYVGDSILGIGVSLGAGTITANLKFNESNVESRVKGKLVDTGRKKLGAIIGDHVRTGINASLFPGVKIGRDAWIGPGAIVRTDLASGARAR